MPYAYVTGADHGLGFSFVTELLDRGWQVAAGRYCEAETDLLDLVERSDGRLMVVPLDVSSDQSVQAAAEAVRQDTDRIDLLLNNAAILGDIERRIDQEPDFDEMQRGINVNALGPLRVTASVVDLVRAADDAIMLNISSESATVSRGWRKAWFGYCMSKAALNRGMRIVRNDLGQDGIQVLCMHPGHLRTWMRGNLDESADTTPDEAADKILRLVLDEGVEDELFFIDSDGEAMPW
jgi:NAD(P)-dependent dehydrogenase (short-subunit alcohol dehydrogenase family)